MKVNRASLNRVARNMGNLDGQVRRNVVGGMERLAGRTENYAKTTRPWTDRTGNARRSIKGVVLEDGNRIGVGLGIGVHYGKWLEVSNGGKYAVVWNTVTVHRQDFINVIKEAFENGD